MILIGVALLILSVLFFPGALSWLTPLTVVVLFVPALIYFFVMPQWRYRVHAWELANHAVYSAEGWFLEKRRIAPLHRVQTVDTIRGPILLRWLKTRYRVTDEALEVRTGVFVRQFRSIPLHRIRTVDLTATPAHRIFDLAILHAGTGSNAGTSGAAKLDSLLRSDADRLRTTLLRHSDQNPADETLLATINLRWLRFAPLTFWAFTSVFIAAGTAYRILDDTGIEPWRIGMVQDAFVTFGQSALWLTIPLALLAIFAVGAIGTTLLYFENWWNYRLEWTDANTLQIRRGLLTTRSVSIERGKLRGVKLNEPMLLRAAGGAKVHAIASGLGNQDQARSRGALLPAAPRSEAIRVCAGVLGAGPLTDPKLITHPLVARRRRLTWGLVGVVLPGVAALLVLGFLLTPILLYCAGIFALVSVPIVWLLARDAYRNLGHSIEGDYVVMRSGTFAKNTHALERSGVLAWTFSSTPFSRRAGVLTLTAAVAASEAGYSSPDPGANAAQAAAESGYRIYDVDADEAAGFVETATPGIISEFLEHDGAQVPTPVH